MRAVTSRVAAPPSRTRISSSSAPSPRNGCCVVRSRILPAEGLASALSHGEPPAAEPRHPVDRWNQVLGVMGRENDLHALARCSLEQREGFAPPGGIEPRDRKSTRLN